MSTAEGSLPGTSHLGFGPMTGRFPADAQIVIVDDAAANVALLERILAGVGVEDVRGFTDPHAALRHCLESQPDLVLLDLHMPTLDGFAVMEALNRRERPEFLPVIVLTADVSTSVKERALASGAKDFLTKPFDRTEVLLRVANLLETRALYRSLELDNASLRATVDAHAARTRAAEQERNEAHSRIDAALRPGALTMAFQPIVELASGRTVGAEALARFAIEPQRPPDQWFAEADRIGRGAELELAAVAAALEQIPRLPDRALLATNVSPSTATSTQLASMLEDQPVDRVVLELTEHDPVHDYDPLVAALDRLQGSGLRIAVDDTGSGYAGFQHLLRLRPDILKLDIALTRGIDTDPVRRALAAALVTFAADIDATIIAEGIETADELTTLQDLGIPWGQGYHLARPGPLPLPT